MRILVTNIRLARRTGTEVVTFETARELTRRGHEVAVYAPLVGDFARRFAAAGIMVADRIEQIAAFAPDIIHGHHATPYAVAQLAFPEVPGIWFCHDGFSWHDTPPDFPQTRLHVHHSPPTRNRLLAEGIPRERLRYLPNAADPGYFVDADPPAALRRALVVAKYGAAFTEALVAALTAAGVEATVVGNGVGAEKDFLLDAILAADIVFGSGKIVLEAIAAGRPVFCIDERGAAGLVTADRFASGRERNFGSAMLTRPLTPGFLAAELALYRPDDFAAMRSACREEIHVETYVDRLLALYDEAIAGGATTLDAARHARFFERIIPIVDEGRVAAGRERIEDLEGRLRERDAELADLRLAQFSFRRTPVMDFSPGQPGATLPSSGFDDPQGSFAWSKARRASLRFPAATEWTIGRVMKFECLVHAPPGPPFDGRRRLRLTSNAMSGEKILDLVNPGSEDIFYSYLFFALDADRVAELDGQDLVVRFEFPDIADGEVAPGLQVFRAEAER